jgi:hypothetical protein
VFEIAGLLLAIVGVLFAFETPRRKFVSIFGVKAKSQSTTDQRPGLTTKLSEPQSVISGAIQSGRTPFFISEPIFDLLEAKKKSHESGKPLFLVIYDAEHPTKSKLDYSLGCFLDYFTTKKLLDQHFICALLPASASGAKEYVPEDDPLENALLVVVGANGEILKREGVYANPDEGLKRVRSLISQLSDT